MPVRKTKTARRKGKRKTFTCKLELCQKKFESNNKAPQFCSPECRSSYEILQWAPKLLKMKKEGKTKRQIAMEFGISRGAVITRASRLNGHQNGHGGSYQRLVHIAAFCESIKGENNE